MSPERDLNPRPLPYQGNALPAELSGRRILEQYKILLRLLIDGRMSVLQTFSGRLNIAPVQMSYSGMVPVWFRYGSGMVPVWSRRMAGAGSGALQTHHSHNEIFLLFVSRLAERTNTALAFLQLASHWCFVSGASNFLIFAKSSVFRSGIRAARPP